MAIATLVGGDRVVGIGVDTASVADSERSLRTFGAAYVRRVCAPSEAATLPEGRAARAGAITALWAAKEAVTKTLAPAAHESWPWPAIEVDLSSGSVRLHGRAGELARRAGIDRVVVATAGTTPAGGPLHDGVSPDRHNGGHQPADGRVTMVAMATARTRPDLAPPSTSTPRRTT